MKSSKQHARSRNRRGRSRAKLYCERLEDRVLLAADTFEPNDRPTQPTDLGGFEQYHMGLTIDQSGDDDWYRWSPFVAGPVSVELRFKHAAGDLGVEVVGARNQTIARSDTKTDNESVQWESAAGASYLVHVFGVRGATQNDYAMLLDMPGQWIRPDQLEGKLRNDDFATAADVGVAPLLQKSLTLDFDPIEDVVDRADVYRFVASDHGTVAVDVSFRHDLGNIDVQLFDVQQKLLDTSASSRDHEHVASSVSADQPYFVRVFSPEASPSPGYDLEIGFEPTSPLFIADIPDQVILEDTSMGPIPFAVGAAGTSPDTLTVTATSDNASLLPAGAITLGGKGSQRLVTATPAPDQSGDATITLTVTDVTGQATSDSFVLLVEPVNDAPVNHVPGQQTMEEDTQLVFSPAANNPLFTSDVDAGKASIEAVLTVDQGILKLGFVDGLNAAQGNGTGAITVSGPIAAINEALDGLTYIPPRDFFGTAALTLATNDLGNRGAGGPQGDESKVLIVVQDVPDVNRPPEISFIPDQTTLEGEPTQPAPFRVFDPDPGDRPLLVRATTSTPWLIDKILVRGDGADRTIAVVPARHRIGDAQITVTVDDQRGGTATAAFKVTVEPLPDTDGDGLLDRWETEGLDFNQDGIMDLDLPRLGANPERKDLFVEVDTMVGRGPLVLPEPDPNVPAELATGTVLDRVIASFMDSPVENPDGTTGVRLHIQLDETDIPLQDFSLGWDEFDRIKCGPDGECGPDGVSDGRFGTAQQRAEPNGANIIGAKSLVYRYAMFANRRGTDGMAGLSERPGNDLMITLGDWITPEGLPGGTAEQQTGTFMHELGHNLGLGHGGGDEVNYKPNYYSVMNYHWQVPSRNSGWALDYSRQQLPTLDENNLDESVGLGFAAGGIHDTEDHKIHVGPSLGQRVAMVGPVDWNNDGDTNDTGVRLDINNDGQFGLVAGYNDWQNLRFTFRDLIGYDDGVHTCSVVDDEGCEDVEEQNPLDPQTSYAVLEDEFEPNDSRAEVSDLADLASEDTTLSANVHESTNEDWYRWTAPIRGVLELVLQKDQDTDIDLSLAFHDALGALIASGTVISEGETDVVQAESAIDAGTVYYVDATSPDTGYYSLRVDAPEVWDGDAARGTAGDGTQWANRNNWTVDETRDDRPPDETDHVTFDVASVSRSVDLAGAGRAVKSLTFLGDYTLSNGVLDVISGLVAVASGVTTTLASDLTIPTGIVKEDTGMLVVNGQLGGLNEVLEGTLGGSGTLSSLLVQPGGRVAPGSSIGTLTVTGATTILGLLSAEVGSTGADRINASGPVTLTGSALELTAISGLQLEGGAPEVGEATRTIVTGSSISGSFATVPDASQHLGYGVFVRDFDGADSPLRYNSTSVEIGLFQAAAGDANGDGRFDQVDIIRVLQGLKYLSGQPATWQQGDWDGNGRFDTLDLVAALQTGNYLQGPYAAE